MGIQGLIPFVSNATRSSHVSEFSGQRVAIDVSCLLHRGVFGCVEQIAHNKNTNFCINYIQRYLGAFLHYNCAVTLVFDGSSLPAKQAINEARRVRRESNQAMSARLLDQGHTDEAYRVMRQGIGVPRDITLGAIKHFSRKANVDVIVAPYEADAQLAYLAMNDLADVVVTQDSDLIVFGCDKVVFKLEANGNCNIFEKRFLQKCLHPGLAKSFTFEKFRRLCILRGCDYLDKGVPGVGLKKAAEYFARSSVSDPKKFLPRVPGYFGLRNVKIDEEFIQQYIEAENTFLHQIVYDPINKIQLPLTPYPGTRLEDYYKVTDDLIAISEKYLYAGRLAEPEEALEQATATLKENTVPSPTVKTRPITAYYKPVAQEAL